MWPPDAARPLLPSPQPGGVTNPHTAGCSSESNPPTPPVPIPKRPQPALLAAGSTAGVQPTQALLARGLLIRLTPCTSLAFNPPRHSLVQWHLPPPSSTPHTLMAHEELRPKLWQPAFESYACVCAGPAASPPGEASEGVPRHLTRFDQHRGALSPESVLTPSAADTPAPSLTK